MAETGSSTSRPVANEGASIFTDFCHVTEDGNRRIAEAIAREVVKAKKNGRGHRL